MRVHQNLLKRGRLHPGIFRERNDGMSVDWAKYSTPELSRARAGEPLANGIMELNVGIVRSINDLQVVHEPVQPGEDPKQPLGNRSHSEVQGVEDDELKTENRGELFRHFNTLVIWPGDPLQDAP